MGASLWISNAKPFLDVPGVGGKTPLVPHFEINQERRDNESVIHTYQTYDGLVGQYVSPQKKNTLIPEVAPQYAEEWHRIKNCKI